MTFDRVSHLDASRLGPRAFGSPRGCEPESRGAFSIHDESPVDVAEREALLDACFGPARFLKTCERLREGRMPADGLALVARDDEGDLIGTIRLWNITAGVDRPALLLGPLAVSESARSLGLGGALMCESLARARALDHRAVLLVGDEPYYRRFGFERRFTEGLTLPGPVERARFLGLELTAGALAGAKGRMRGAAPMGAVRLPRAA